MNTVREMIREGIETGELSEDFIRELTQANPPTSVLICLLQGGVKK